MKLDFRRTGILVTLLALLLLIPQDAFAATSSEWSYSRNTNNRHFGDEIFKEKSYDEDDLLSLYRLRKGELTDHLNTTDKIAPSDKAIWDLFLKIADKKTVDSQILVFGTYEEAGGGMLAYVSKLGKKEQTWALIVNANAANPKSQAWNRDMTVVILHEYAHLLTLSERQIDVKKRSESQCKKLGTILVKPYGCAKSGAYIDVFTKKFWTEADIKTALKDQKKGKYSLYEGRRNDFVTEYASSGPLEDIAESFTDFVLRSKPGGTIVTTRDKKILFFYDYPELVTMRSIIRANTEVYFK